MNHEPMSAAMLRGLDTEVLMVMHSQINDELERRYVLAKQHQIERAAVFQRQLAENEHGDAK